MSRLDPSEEPAVLTIAGTDSSAGAGVARDLLVLRDHKCEARVAVTAVTAQSSQGVQELLAMPATLVREQIMAAANDHCIGAIKIGMLANQEIVETVARCLESFGGVPVVLDPVLASSSGTPLLSAAGALALREQLCPQASLLTPNLIEAATLLGEAQAQNEAEAESQALSLQQMLRCAVLLKGGHATGLHASDYLASTQGSARISDRRLFVAMRGTGCALSTAIAVGLSRGQQLEKACRNAKTYVRRLLSEQPSPAT